LARTYDLCLVDAFTTRPLTGNPAGVILDARGLSPSEMQVIAREVNVSETAFLFPSEGPDEDLRVRFFTPKVEVPLCGHATIAAHHVLAESGRWGRGKSPLSLRQRTAAGIYPVDVTWEEGAPRISMTLPHTEFGPLPPNTPLDRLLELLGLDRSELAEGLPVVTAHAGEFTVFVPLRSRAVLDSLEPHLGQLASSYASYFLFTLDAGEKGYLTASRMFAPGFGVNEDPVTGLAHGPLGAYLLTYGAVHAEGEEFHFLSRQGSALGRPGTVEVSVERREGAVRRIRVAGRAVTVLKGRLDLG